MVDPAGMTTTTRSSPIWTWGVPSLAARDIRSIEEARMEAGDMSKQMNWFASASLANPYCQSTWMCVCLYVCMSEFLRSNISETKGARGSVTMGSL